MISVGVGADNIRPVVFPMGKQRRRNAPTMHHRTFCNIIRRNNVETWYFRNIGAPVWPIRFCSKTCNVGGRLIAVMLLSDRPRRSFYFDSLRGAPPYRACATESPPRKTQTGTRPSWVMSRFVLLFVKNYGMLINGTTSIPVSGSPDFFRG